MIIKVEVEFAVDETVYFKVDSEKPVLVVGYKIIEDTVTYQVANPEFGIVEALGMELTRDREVY